MSSGTVNSMRSFSPHTAVYDEEDGQVESSDQAEPHAPVAATTHSRNHSATSPTSMTAMLPRSHEQDFDDAYTQPLTQHSNAKSTTRGGGVNDDYDGFSSEAAAADHDRDATFADELFAPVTEWADQMHWSRSKPPIEKRRKWLLLLSYAPDWIITILLALLLALTDKAHGFRREFSLTDTSIQHTHAESSRVPVWLLVVISLLGPIVIQAVFSLAITRSFWDFHASILGLVVSHAISVTMTNILKVTVGRPRPDLIDRCQPRPGSVNAAVYGLVTDAICQNDVNEHLVTDGFRSFPSGHSSTAFAGLAFLSFYLAGKLHLFSTRSKGHAAVSWIVFFPMAAATMIAVSRTMDYRHHATDVIAGGILGTLTAFGVYSVYYPSLRSPWCHKPLAPRITRRRSGGGGGLASTTHAANATPSTAALELDSAARTGPAAHGVQDLETGRGGSLA